MKFEMKDLHVAVNAEQSSANTAVQRERKEIISGISLTINSGEVHALMGPNGSGKSTLSLALMGHPKYKITHGDILLNGKSIINLPANERAKLGVFLGFQYPQEVEGVGISNFLRTVLARTNDGAPAVKEFHKQLKEKMSQLGMPEEFLKRGLNHGFSGGEKKRSEILQLEVLKPKFAILDEPDSGTDVDGLKSVAAGIKETVAENKTGVLLITHYNRILEHVKPDFVHIIVDGKIVNSGGAELARETEKSGYDSLKVAEAAAQ
ncbi:MAG: Fe-S cluster assembly ATPase SufC [DPANN group archaeon]|nr:Fe-S cluster assembly ATPase SufC [DPANN group archaeon]